MKIKPRGKIYSINEGYAKFWYDPVIDYVDSKKNPKVSSDWKKLFTAKELYFNSIHM